MWFVLLSGFFLVTAMPVEGKFKNLECTMFDKNYGEFKYCRIKAINRYRNSINIFYRQIQPVENAIIRMELFKRANGWRPFLYNLTVNLCDLLQRNKNFIMRLAYSYVQPFLILNYTCPFKTNDWVECRNFELDMEMLRTRFPFPSGEYAAQITFYYQNVRKVSVNGSVEYVNYRDP